MAQGATKLEVEHVNRPAVRRSVLLYTLILAVIQVGVAFLLAYLPGPARLGWIYLISAMLWTSLTAWITMRNVHLLYTMEGRPVSRLNLATRVTLIRILAVPLVASLIMVQQYLAAGFVFLGAALTDWLDGFLARRMRDITQLGRIADPSIDALFCGITFFALAGSGILPLWVTILVLLRYGVLFIGAGLLRYLLGYLPVRATFTGRVFYLLQYSLLVLILLMGSRSDWLLWLTRVLGAIQVIVALQLIGLGRSLYQEARRVA